MHICIPGDPRKSDKLVLFNNFTSSKDRTKSLDGKEAEFYKDFSDINDLKIRQSVTTQRLRGTPVRIIMLSVDV